MTDDDSVLNVPKIGVPVRGCIVEVAPLTLQQIGPFITAARPVIGRAVVAISYAQAETSVQTGALLLDLLEQDGPSVAKALSVVTGKEVDWILGASLDEISELVAAVVSLNTDFFARRLPNLLVRARQALPETTVTNMAGRTSSNTSSPTDTATATS